MPNLQLDSAVGQSIINQALLEIDLCLQDHNTRLSNFPQMPQPESASALSLRLHLKDQELCYNVNDL
jgi:hypothetical protein